MSGTQALAFKAALFAACQTLFPSPILVTYGHPGAASADDMIAVMNVDSTQNWATMSTNRSREELLTVEVIFSCWSGGTDQQSVTERAYGYVRQLETYLQDPGVTSSLQVNLGGIVRWAMVTEHTLAETADPNDLALGRIAEVTATVRAPVRI